MSRATKRRRAAGTQSPEELPGLGADISPEAAALDLAKLREIDPVYYDLVRMEMALHLARLKDDV